VVSRLINGFTQILGWTRRTWWNTRMSICAALLGLPASLVAHPQRSMAPTTVPHRARAIKLMPPPLNPTAAGYPLSEPGKPVVIELFLDLICPFSSKMYKVVHDEVLGAFGEQVSFVVHQVPQPWHPQGSYVHEVALAVKQVEPQLYPAVCRALYAAYDAGKFTDEDTWSKSRADIYEDLLDVVAGAGVERSLYPAMLSNTGSGTPMTQALKWAVKYHRTRSVHITPTVFVNGLEAGVVSSGWKADQWSAFLGPMGADNWQGSKLE